MIDLTNNGTEDISVSDDMAGYFESSDGTQYNNPLIAVEDRDDYLDQYSSIKPLTTSKVHIGYTVPTDITTGTAYFSIMGELYSVDYDASVDISSKTSVSMNQEITVDDVASFELLGTNYTADVLPLIHPASIRIIPSTTPQTTYTLLFTAILRTIQLPQSVPMT